MQRYKPLSRKEREIITILSDPVLWGQYYLRNRDGSPRSYWKHQADELSAKDRNVIHRDGREVGKTVCICTDVLYYAFTTRGGSGLVATPHQGHLETVIDEIEFQIAESPKIEASIAKNYRGLPKIKRIPYLKIEFTSGTIIHFRPAGAYGDSFRGLHVDRLWVDEAAWLPEKAWKSLRQCVNANGRIRIYSTPNGLRNSTYYRLTHTRGWEVFRWPSWKNPNWDDNRERELEDFYGGRDTAGWQHEVAGEHGSPTYAVFNLERFNSCRRKLPDYQHVTISPEVISDCQDERTIRERLDALLNMAPMDGTFWVGGDLGYSNDPTEITVWHEFDGVFHSGNLVTRPENNKITQETSKHKVMKLIFRVRMEHIAYPIISEAIALIDRYYKPKGIGVDNGGNGGAVVQELLTLDKFRKQNFTRRLMGIDFGSSTNAGLSDDGKPIKRRTKEYMTLLLEGAFQRRQILLPLQDMDIENEFTTHTYSLTSDGRIRYSKGSDHIIDSARCAFYVRDQNNFSDGNPRIITDFPRPMPTDPIF